MLPNCQTLLYTAFTQSVQATPNEWRINESPSDSFEASATIKYAYDAPGSRTAHHAS